MSARAVKARSDRPVCIGLDLDNTIISYRQLFAEAAITSGLIAPGFVGDKLSLRQAVRALPDGERRWTELQAEVYGTRIMAAPMMPGALDFVRRAVASSIPVAIVSHKTKRPASDPSGIDLRAAALAWLDHQGFIAENALRIEAIFFETTRAEKIARIRALDCTAFVDDLIEVFEDADFPPDVDRLLIAQDGADPGDYRIVRSWQQVEDVLLSGYRHVR
jgi:hypothetical protein